MPRTAELALPEPTPACYTTEEELTESLGRKGTPEPGPGLYPRDGTADVTEVEAALSELTIPGQRHNVVVASGMAAVSGAVRFALAVQGEARGSAPSLLHSRDLYPQSTRGFTGLKRMGVEVTSFDVADHKAARASAETRQPDVVFSETVSNTLNSAVFDTRGFIQRHRAAGDDAPILVLDNTLPLSTGLDFNELLKPEDRVLVVESATKSALHNSGHLGVVYSKNLDLIDQFRKFKATEGLVTSTQADAAILRSLEATTPGFHDRNLALYASTAKIALALADAVEELGPKADFVVDSPTLEDHANHEYAAANLPDGGSPVVFLGCTDFEQDAAKKLLQRISFHPRIVEQINEGQIFFGQSFGFKQARLLYDETQVRIAGGYDIDSESLAEAIREAAADI